MKLRYLPISILTAIFLTACGESSSIEGGWICNAAGIPTIIFEKSTFSTINEGNPNGRDPLARAYVKIVGEYHIDGSKLTTVAHDSFFVFSESDYEADAVFKANQTSYIRIGDRSYKSVTPTRMTDIYEIASVTSSELNMQRIAAFNSQGGNRNVPEVGMRPFKCRRTNAGG